MWGKITLEPGAGDTIKNSIEKAYDFMMENRSFSTEWEFHANGAKIPMTVFSKVYYRTGYRRPEEIYDEYEKFRKSQ